jgi:1,4-dihydroxy-2-naphthoate octaprenyltransferase
MPIVLAVLPSFFLGTLFALILESDFIPLTFLYGFAILFIIEIGASFANDYFDYEADKYNKQFGFSGGSGVLLDYPELRSFAKWSSITLMILALALTLFFTLKLFYPWWIIGYIGIAVFFCWFYTAPPIRLVYRGWGELPHMLAGIMFPGWGYLLVTTTINWSLLIFAIPFGFYGLSVILNFEIPDKEADIHGGKKNLVVLKGRQFVFQLILALYILATIYFFLLSLVGWLDDKINFWIITVISFIPLSIALSAVIKRPTSKKATTMYAIRNAIFGFSTTLLIMIYFILLLL